MSTNQSNPQRDDLRGTRDPRRDRDIAEGRQAGSSVEQQTRSSANPSDSPRQAEGKTQNTGPNTGESLQQPQKGFKHEDPDIRGNVDRGSDDDVEHSQRPGQPRIDDKLAEEPGIGP